MTGKQQQVTITTLRPIPTCDADELGYKAGIPVPAGTTFTFDVSTEGHCLLAGGTADIPLTEQGHIDDEAAILRACAAVPCQNLYTDHCDCCDGQCNHDDWFGCSIYDDESVLVCLGDATRCHALEIRAAALTEKEAQQ